MRTSSMISSRSLIKSASQFILLLACLTLCCPQKGWSESNKLNEYEVKAAYLYNFAKYVEWPATQFPRENSPLTICVAGSSPLNEVIESLAGKTIKNRRLTIRHFSRIEDLNECNILFINASAKNSLAQMLASVAPRSILTISDYTGFTTVGGIIELIPVGDKIRFNINKRAAQQVNLRISSHLLRLATTVME